MKRDKELEHINAIKVTKEDLLGILNECAERHEKGLAEAGDGIYIVVSRFHDQHDKGMAVFFRMEALNKLIDKINTPGFTMPVKQKDFIWVREELAEVAATYPLIKVKKRYCFEVEGFLAKAFELREPEGTC